MGLGVKNLMQILGVVIFFTAPFCVSEASNIHKAAFAPKHGQAETRALERKLEKRFKAKTKKSEMNGLNGKRYSARSGRYNFILKNYKFSGNHKLTDAEVKEIVAPFIGKKFTKDVEIKILKTISNLYNKKGFPFSFVQQIIVKNNSLNIKLLEGHINEIYYDKRFDKDPLFKHYIDKLKEMRPYDKKKGRYYFELIKKRPGVNGNLEIMTRILTPVKKIDPNNPASVNITIKNLYYGVTGILEVNNRQRVDHTQQIQTSANDNPTIEYQGSNYAQNVTHFNNMFGKGEKISVNYLTTGSKEDQAFTLGLRYPIGLKGAHVFSDFSYNDSQVNNKQKITYATLGYNHPLYVDFDHDLDANIAFQKYREQQQNSSLTMSDRRIHINKAILGLNYQYGKHIVDFGYHQSLTDVKKQNDDNDPGNSTHFNKLTLAVDSMFKLPYYGLDFIYRFDGQYSNHDLFFAESFSAGVYQGGRGFTSSEIFGDSGISNSFELSKTFYVDDHPLLASHREYIYIDDAHVISNVSDNTKPKSGSITSVGIGSEISVVDNITFNVEFSKPISEQTKGDERTRKKRPKSKVYIGMEYAYMF
ncbi:MAG: ShlB/FhaC/HecB family hemolysin secretion/activation protein [Rickettsiales bacterium]